MFDKQNSTICSVKELLEMDLEIPYYQRPYKWERNNVLDLLYDIKYAINKFDEYKEKNEDFKYRIGTIILHKDEYDNIGKYKIVDGQQRIITLYLIKSFFKNNKDGKTIKVKKTMNLFDNYTIINKFFSSNGNVIENYEKAFDKILEVVVLKVNKESEAFQLFDSQNTRGKELYPHDLLKAYHLRIMEHEFCEKDKKSIVNQWEENENSNERNYKNVPINNIKKLFEHYLFPIYNWSHNLNNKIFSSKEIEVYKGINGNLKYHYVNILKNKEKGNAPFQIYEPFLAGKSFFDMVNYYIKLKNATIKNVYAMLFDDISQNVKEIFDLKNILPNREEFKELKPLEEYASNKGFLYAQRLFECAILCYYDRFLNFDDKIEQFEKIENEQEHKQAIKNIFNWAFMIRIDSQRLAEDTINRYSIKSQNNWYTNEIQMFYEIVNAKTLREIANLKIETDVKNQKNKDYNKRWKVLYKIIKEFNGEEYDG